MMTSQEEQLAKARELTTEVERLHEQIDTLVEPICQQVLATGDVQAVKDLVNQLPRGFHRSELRTWLCQKEKND